MRTLLIDNYDSYTYNLFQVIAEVNGEIPLVYNNDEITLEQIQAMVHAGTVHSIVISPGPGTPSNPQDIGVCLDVLHHLPDVPILGICLGHQALALAHGAAVVAAPEPVHGRVSRLSHSGHGLFADIPSGHGFEVVRYHSLLVDQATLPHCLQPVCWTDGAHVAVKLARDAAGAAGTAGTDGPGQEAGAEGTATEAEAERPESVEGAQPAASSSGRGQEGAQLGGSLLMGLVHRSRPHYGVQFHPESVATKYGIALLRNFRDLAAAHLRARGGPAAAQLQPARVVPDIVGPPGRLPELPVWPSPEHQCGAPLRLAWARLPGVLEALGGSQGVFERLYGWAEDTFWLDSAAADRGRFSYMGGRGGPLWRKLTYKLPPPPQQQQQQQQHQPQSCSSPVPHSSNANQAQAEQMHDADSDAGSATSSACASSASGTACSSAAAGGGSASAPPHATHAVPAGTLTVESSSGAAASGLVADGLLSHLQRLLARERLRVDADAAAALPFNFWGGLVGYLGYELKAECGAANAHAASTPDAVLWLADRMVAVDHQCGDVYLLALHDSGEAQGSRRGGGDGRGEQRVGVGEGETRGGQAATHGAGPGARNACSEEPGQGMAKESKDACGLDAVLADWASAVSPAEQEAAARAWVADTQRQLEHAAAQTVERRAAAASASTSAAAAGPGSAVPFKLEHSRAAYINNIAACHTALYAGESYEVCLTTALARAAAPDPAVLYSTLRRMNPAPYAAWLQCGAAGPTICCSSPERFLRGDRGGLLEARPIKGTAARVAADAAADAAAAEALARSEKERAENLMIVDLLRNDLGRVCEVGSVHVPGLMDIESYATVHQMVSTVRGVRRGGVSVIDCFRAAFPGGSMTGAPKVRTMQIIDGLEARARGVYSGCIGFISLNDTFDLNIVIRTAVIEQEPPHAQRKEQQQQAPVASAAGAGAAAGCEGPARRRMTIGAGGAIVVQSDPVAEYEEMRLKASALLRAVALCEGGSGPIPVVAE
ncbi:hypothetical protein HXX76_002676 [Chlamydomonas incerta]|uniref:aminodeoxychorismate synthase n=1 Tax=Chlamydomonas incerta TaxID=51695 RepID=A0A835TEI1_CHLIN|nr:hypothetical protein HXX76_002676 [Chlamydomonas incerta]|eukprot:KAG2442591.1 hypothetical protein HXX76_002676 [Chlamydomonas incerta]